MRLPYTPSYARRFSSQAYFTGKRAKDRTEFIAIHDVDPEYSPDPIEYDVFLSDVTHVNCKLQFQNIWTFHTFQRRQNLMPKK